MKGTVTELALGKRRLTVYRPPACKAAAANGSVAYLLAGENFAANLPQVAEALEPAFDRELPPFFLVLVPPLDWNDDFTPWPAPRLPGREADFRGGAPEFLSFLVTEAQTAVQRAFDIRPVPERTALLGYSLGGLTAAFSLFTTGAFGRVGSLSGSLWYEGFLDYAESRPLCRTDVRVYLSLGKREEHTRNPVMAQVGDCTRRLEKRLAAQLDTPGQVRLEWNQGGHFHQVPERFAKALRWLMAEEKEK
ncbi:MAG: alpha/beta hydrolase [Oscillospiraceae bacterium]